ncbi:MAG: FtsX-like permease family protein [Corynebacterium sp.]|nr:FtsX-like permease family protein [Corynebacterium sp.]
MTLKIALYSVTKGAASWLALIVTSVALAVVLTLNIGLIVAGSATEGEAQQGYAAMGGVALGFSLLTGLASFVLVVGICVRLQRRDVALWQIVGLLPRAAFNIMITEILLVSVVSAVVGSLVAIAVWPPYARFVSTSGLPPSEVLHQGIPPIALIIGISITAGISVLAGVRSSWKVVRDNLVESVKSSTTFEAKARSIPARIAMLLVAVLLVFGVGAIYRAIGTAELITDPSRVGNFLTSYPGMGLLLCLVFALVGGPIVRFFVHIVKSMPVGRIPVFLATREAAARPRLTQAIVIPMSLAAAAVGIMVEWVDKLTAIMAAETGSTNAVSAPPEQVALLLGGPVIAACVAAAAIVFATASNRQEDNALLLVSGTTPGVVYAKALLEAIVYGVVACACAYLIVVVNEIAMVAALNAGPIPSATFSMPGWSGAAVVGFGIALTILMLLVITSTGLRKQSINVVLGGT